MRIFKVNKNEYYVDQEGNLLDYNLWTKEFAEAVAKENNIVLRDIHWKIIDYVRKYYEVDKVMPPKKQIKKEFDLSERDISELFPMQYKDGYLYLLSKLAGLPVPTGDI
ncbi:tRNA 2-thiouridine synthesizing protein E [Thermodesulfobium acidiphilum]|uniref:tRNA 2-thiouridine synthesizing protein E n=1 Tax=Thermodesulfobium acidiphilum TaxID=1794699 RepID=A0A2R4W1S2_THEAF|nr:TusE/DsrC/DsvC family sulfur relay protein [Thermodesulfobium acidiphilum]AWB10638.1 tRNA 2-thiouridine synthesizing protein E [Thermodesulfobium acidiphilum]